MPTIALIIAGCGRGDGSEIHEATSCLIHLARHKLAYQCFAPDAPQFDVINHVTGQADPSQSRNLMVEAARIARGNIKPLSALNPADFQALVFPGGFGAAKNLCDFAIKGEQATVKPDIERLIKAFHAAKKPIALCCIAPVLAARTLGKSFGGPGCRVTLGAASPVAAAIEKWGNQHEVQPVTGVCIDRENRLITTPAYMYDDATPFGVFSGIGGMIEAMIPLIG